MNILLLWGRPVTAWGSIFTGAVAILLLITAILLMSGRIYLPVSHKKVAYSAMGVIAVHAIIGLVARFILGI